MVLNDAMNCTEGYNFRPDRHGNYNTIFGIKV